MKKILVFSIKTLEMLLAVFAMFFGGLAFGLAAIPAVVAAGCLWLSEELSGEWRRDRQQTRLGRWVRELKNG